MIIQELLGNIKELTRIIHKYLELCWRNAHTWGRKHRVIFEASKEAFIILHPRRGWGEDFKLLGLIIDARLTMENDVAALLQKAHPKCRSLLRVRNFYSIFVMIM